MGGVAIRNLGPGTKYPCTRDMARQQDNPLYFTGKPCPKGHITVRYTSNGGCRACLSPKWGASYTPLPIGFQEAPLPPVPLGLRLCRRGLHMFVGRTCGECRKQSNQEWNRLYKNETQGLRYLRFRKFVRNLRENTPCMDCQCTFPWYVMEFDHRDGHNEDYISIARLTGMGNMDRLKREIAKCDLVCAICHKIRTYTRAIASGRMKDVDFEGFDFDLPVPRAHHPKRKNLDSKSTTPPASKKD